MLSLTIAILGIADEQAGTRSSFAVPVPGPSRSTRLMPPSLISYRRLRWKNDWNIFRGSSWVT
ncbi:hypothetical protein AJ87_42000 [Rhizobium yanglingense]|nr:hypothetical protein AJ87_42000 [Rhizobium yanglingense]